MKARRDTRQRKQDRGGRKFTQEEVSANWRVEERRHYVEAADGELVGSAVGGIASVGNFVGNLKEEGHIYQLDGTGAGGGGGGGTSSETPWEIS